MLTILCLLTVSCSFKASNEFERIISRVDKYLSERPVLITSEQITKDGKEMYAYYAYKIIKYELHHTINWTFSSSSPYSASIKISCDALDNAQSGDLFSDISEFQTKLEIIAREASGFSTTQMALDHPAFTKESRWTITVEYAYREDGWIYLGMTGGPPSDYFVSDLERFPQNKRFRDAIGMHI